MTKSSTKVMIWGCGLAALACFAAVVAVVIFVAHVSQDVKGAGVSVSGPTDVVVGQTFELTVTVTNERPRKVLALSDIDIAEDYLAGFTLSTIEPKPKSSTHIPIDNTRSFTFGVQIPPETASHFTFTLRAEQSGVYRGDVDICEGLRFVTGMAQTSVKSPD